VEEVLASIWAKVLGVERVGVQDNFFELGGHSLKATQVRSRLREIFRVELTLRVLFEKPTIPGIACAIAEVFGGMDVPQKIAQIWLQMEQFPEENRDCERGDQNHVLDKEPSVRQKQRLVS